MHTMYKCTENDCKYQTKYKSSLKRHLTNVHEIGVEWHHCSIEDCDFKAKESGSLKRHLGDVHDIGVKWHHCSIQDCAYKSKTADNLNRHLVNIHDIGVEWHHCSIQDCHYKSKDAGNLKQHLANMHDIGVKWYHCSIQDCAYKSKTADKLNRHLVNIHDIGVEWHHCSIQDCHYKSKDAGNLKRHLQQVHDVGDYMCEYCACNRNTSIEYTCKKSGITSHICRACHDTATGAKVRKETAWSKYIDEHFGTEYLLLSDRSLKSEGGCILERPDKLHTSPDLVILSECDEHQHTYHNRDYTCEEERLSKIYDEPGICGKNMVVIRWNPDSYQAPEGYKKLKKAERHELHVAVMNFILAHPEVIQGKVHVFYLLFSQDNPKIAKHYPVSMIYDKSDLALDKNGKSQVNTVMPTRLQNVPDDDLPESLAGLTVS